MTSVPLGRLCTCELRGDTPRICSHVAVQQCTAGQPMFKDLQALAWAGAQLDLEIVDKRDYRWYGKSVGDFPTPAGMTASELGHNALFVLRVKEPKRLQLRAQYGQEPYEIGIVEDPNNPGCFIPVYDFWAGGHGIDELCGSPIYEEGKLKTLLPKLKQHYDMRCDALAAREAGDEIAFFSHKEASQKYPRYLSESHDETTFVSIATTEARIGQGDNMIVTIYKADGTKTRQPQGYGSGLCHEATAPYEQREIAGQVTKTPTAEACQPAAVETTVPVKQTQKAR